MKERARRPRMQCESDIWDTFNKPMNKLSLGFEAAKYKASIKSSPVVFNNVFQIVVLIFVNLVMVYTEHFKQK